MARAPKKVAPQLDVTQSVAAPEAVASVPSAEAPATETTPPPTQTPKNEPTASAAGPFGIVVVTY